MSTRDRNYERLVQLAIEQNPTWHWTHCVVCGEPSTTAGVVLLPLTAALGRIGWCERDECRQDMAAMAVALPTIDAAVAALTTARTPEPRAESAETEEVR